ncbi:hypothetical protein HYH02_010501 [Chlamydomonas schloesseri]|uniref:RING-type domain-containing protein n=1 Tax=Chlamydomonas schloesseri TaxID=2026947 RepID=A0A835W8K7_9CHLO|nr:hypothetical protein HYH02_010501 [Chlamydomonas schloesseri]|eukprot:KAG2439871.1 hypothetical protein HYH02_010501 [Chlamydomonas schloesseri]
MLNAEAFDCSICANLLLDPVVGPCGHDFCRGCLESWRQATCARGRRGNCAGPVPCPICRKALPTELGVCLRLRETIQTLFPDKVKERRAEVEERRAAAAAAAAASASLAAAAPTASSSNRRPASGAPGVHRSNIPWSGSSSFGAGSSSTGVGASHGPLFGPAAFFGAAAMQPTFAGPAPSLTAAAATTTATVATTTAPAVDTWTYSGSLCFSLGWHDPNENRGRRSWGRRRRAVAV